MRKNMQKILFQQKKSLISTIKSREKGRGEREVVREEREECVGHRRTYSD